MSDERKMMSHPPSVPNIVLDPNVLPNTSRGASPAGPPTPSTPVVHLLSKPRSSQDPLSTYPIPPSSSDALLPDQPQAQNLHFASLMPRPLSAPSNMVPSPAQAAAPAEVDSSIVEALKSSKDRLYVLKLAESMEELIRDRAVGSRIDLRPASSYQRLLVHRCAGYYNLQLELSSTTIAVITTPESRIPSKRIGELVPPEESPFPTIQIMRRTDRSAKTSKTSSRATSADGNVSEEGEPAASSHSQGSGSNPNKKKYMTIEEREAAYNEARSRIFEGFEEGASTTGTASSVSLDGDEASTAPTESDAAPSPNVLRKDWGYNERWAGRGGSRFVNGSGDIPRNQPSGLRGNPAPYMSNGPPIPGPYMGLYDPNAPSTSNPVPYDPNTHSSQSGPGPYPYGYPPMYPGYWPYYLGYYPPQAPQTSNANQNQDGSQGAPMYGNPPQFGPVPPQYLWPPQPQQPPGQPQPPPMPPHVPQVQPQPIGYPQPPAGMPPQQPPLNPNRAPGQGEFYPNNGYPYFPQQRFPPAGPPGPQPPPVNQTPPSMPPQQSGWMPPPPPQQPLQPQQPWNGAPPGMNGAPSGMNGAPPGMNGAPPPPQVGTLNSSPAAKRTAPPIRGPWSGYSFGPGVSVGGMPINNQPSMANAATTHPNTSTSSLNGAIGAGVGVGVRPPPDGLGIRVMPPITLPYPPGISAMGSGYSSGSSSAGSLRRRERTSSAATSASGNGGRADETCSIASSSSSSSKRTYTSTTSSQQHPLPERPDWVMQIRPSHNASRAHSHHSHSSFHSSRAASAQGSPAGLQAKDFPPLGGPARQGAPGSGRTGPALNGVWGAPRMNNNSSAATAAVGRLDEHDKNFERGAIGKTPGELYNPRDIKRREKEVTYGNPIEKDGGKDKEKERESSTGVADRPTSAEIESVTQSVGALGVTS